MPEWPSQGSIEIDGLSVRYRPELPDILDNIQLHIRPGEKVRFHSPLLFVLSKIL